MALEEQVEQQAQQALEGAARTGATIGVRVGESLARQLVKSAGWAIRQGGHRISEASASGKVSEARLQKITGGDIHDLQFDPATMREVTKSLRQSGVTYAVEKIDDQHWRLMFTGKDQDHVRIAMERAFAKLGLKFDFHEAVEIDQPKPETQDETPSQGSPSAPDNDSPTAPEQASQTEEQPVPSTGEPAAQGTGESDERETTPDRSATVEHGSDPEPRVETKDRDAPSGKDSQAARDPQKHSDKPRTPGRERKSGKHTKKEFLEQLHQRANEKLAASRQAPELAKSRSRSK